MLTTAFVKGYAHNHAPCASLLEKVCGSPCEHRLSNWQYCTYSLLTKSTTHSDITSEMIRAFDTPQKNLIKKIIIISFVPLKFCCWHCHCLPSLLQNKCITTLCTSRMETTDMKRKLFNKSCQKNNDQFSFV